MQFHGSPQISLQILSHMLAFVLAVQQICFLVLSSTRNVIHRTHCPYFVLKTVKLPFIPILHPSLYTQSQTWNKLTEVWWFHTMPSTLNSFACFYAWWKKVQNMSQSEYLCQECKMRPAELEMETDRDHRSVMTKKHILQSYKVNDR